MSAPSLRRVRLACTLAAAALPASAGVLVVDAARGGDFGPLHDAVAAAVDGDTLLVRPGDDCVYDAQLELHASLVIAADGAGPVLTSPLVVSLADPGQRVLLRGLTLEAGTFSPTTTGLAAGGARLLVSGSTVRGGDGGSGDGIPGSFGTETYAGGHALELGGLVEVALRDAVLSPGAPGVDGAGQPGLPGDALHAGPTVTVVLLPGTQRALACGAPVAEGGTLSLAYAGDAGDLVGLFLATTLAVPVPAVKHASFHPGAPLPSSATTPIVLAAGL